MAIVMRESGAWKTVVNKLKQEKISVNNADDLPKLLNAEQIKHAEFLRVFELKRQEADQHYNDELSKIPAEQERSLLLIRKEYSRKIKSVQDKIDAIKKQRYEIEGKSFFYKLFHLVDVIKLRRNGKQIDRRYENILSEKDDKLQRAGGLFDRKLLDANQVRNHVIYDLKKEIDGAKRRVTIIEETLKSNDYYGAVAELKMIDFLKKLPDNYYVINDVCIKLTKSIRFNDEWISSVQIDHIVVGNFGIFIIEVKNWSKKFATEGNYHDPYRQIERYNRAFYIILKDYFSVKLKNIIAYTGHLPSKKDKKYITVRYIENVTDYILWFKEQIYDQKTVQEIVTFIEGKINNDPFC